MFSLIQTIQLPCHEHAQRKNLDLIEAANESRVVINVLQEERDDDIVWEYPGVGRAVWNSQGKRVSMGLTDRRKTAKNLFDSRKNWKILTVSRK